MIHNYEAVTRLNDNSPRGTITVETYYGGVLTERTVVENRIKIHHFRADELTFKGVDTIERRIASVDDGNGRHTAGSGEEL